MEPAEFIDHPCIGCSTDDAKADDGEQILIESGSETLLTEL